MAFVEVCNFDQYGSAITEHKLIAGSDTYYNRQF